MRLVIAMALTLTLAGCSWFARKPSAASVPTSVAMTSVEPIAAARAACADYDATPRETPFPRDAIVRGIDSGTAWVVFAVDGTKVTVLSVTSSGPAFGSAAEEAVRKLRCTVDHPARFSMGFDWRSAR